MKILYSVQATGNGHISRAMELLPYLKRYGKVDLFLSGANSTLPLDAPIKYRSKGISLFYGCDGSLNYSKMFRHIHLKSIWQQIKDLPVESYDLVINDFECITALACAKKKVSSVNFGHQASFMSKHTPRPSKRSFLGEWILRNYAKATQYIGLHFENYDDFIFSPVIKNRIRAAEPHCNDYFTVYLPAYCDEQLFQCFSKFRDCSFEIFSHEVKSPVQRFNILFKPVDREAFDTSLICCRGLITGGGFETPAEALYLKKKLIVLPIHGQYEQQCNAAALQRFGVPVFDRLDDNFDQHFIQWADDPSFPKLHFRDTTETIINHLMMKAMKTQAQLDLTYPELIFY